MACKYFVGLTTESAGDGLALNRLALARNGYTVYRITGLVVVLSSSSSSSSKCVGFDCQYS